MKNNHLFPSEWITLFYDKADCIFFILSSYFILEGKNLDHLKSKIILMLLFISLALIHILNETFME